MGLAVSTNQTRLFQFYNPECSTGFFGMERVNNKTNIDFGG